MADQRSPRATVMIAVAVGITLLMAGYLLFLKLRVAMILVDVIRSLMIAFLSVI